MKNRFECVRIRPVHIVGFFNLVFSFPILRKIQNYLRQANPSDLVQKLSELEGKMLLLGNRYELSTISKEPVAEEGGYP